MKNLLDGIQIINGLYGLSLLIAYYAAIGTHATWQIVEMLSYFHITGYLWIACLILYVLVSFTCLVWKDDRLRVLVTFFSIWFWCFTGITTVLSPEYITTSGIYELLIATVSVVVLYFRGMTVND